MGTPLPRHWGGPPERRAKVSEPLAIMATEAALEDFRRSQKFERVRDVQQLLESCMLFSISSLVARFLFLCGEEVFCCDLCPRKALAVTM